MSKAIIKQGLIKDEGAFIECINLTSHELFKTLYGPDYESLMRFLYRQPRNLFSHEHTLFMKQDDKIIGMTLSYDYNTKKREELRTGLLIIKELGFKFIKLINNLIKAKKTIGRLSLNDYYLSNIAVLPSYQHKGFGSRLLKNVEQQAIKNNNKRIVLDVETNNKKAIKFYKKNDYLINESLKIKQFNFYRMSKELR